MTKSITSDELGTDGIDIDAMVAINRIVNSDPYVSAAPSNRAKNIADMARNIAPPLVFRLTPSVRTSVEMRLSFFILLFIQSRVVGSVTDLMIKRIEFGIAKGAHRTYLEVLLYTYDEAAAKEVIHGSTNFIRKAYGCFRKTMK